MFVQPVDVDAFWQRLHVIRMLLTEWSETYSIVTTTSVAVISTTISNKSSLTPQLSPSPAAAGLASLNLVSSPP